MKIRSARQEDAVAVGEYIRSILADPTYQVSQIHEFDTTEEGQRKRIRDYSEHAGKLLICAESGARIVGLLDFAVHPRERKRHVGTLGVSVHAEWRRRGIGRLLMESLFNWAAGAPTIEKVTLAVFATNGPAIDLYRSLGFVEEGRRPKEIKIGPGNYVEEILMYRMVK